MSRIGSSDRAYTVRYLTSLLTSALELGHWTSVPAICCSTETDRSTVPSEDVWLSGVFGGKSVSLECITGQSERSRADFRHFQASFEDLLLHVILDVSHVQRIRDLLVSLMRYIIVHFTYLQWRRQLRG